MTDQRRGWLDALKIGDKVVVTHSLNAPWVAEIIDITSLGKFLVARIYDVPTKVSPLIFSPAGTYGKGWNIRTLVPLTEKSEAAIQERNERNRLTDVVDAVDVFSLTTDQLRRMAAIIAESSP